MSRRARRDSRTELSGSHAFIFLIFRTRGGLWLTSITAFAVTLPVGSCSRRVALTLDPIDSLMQRDRDSEGHILAGQFGEPAYQSAGCFVLDPQAHSLRSLSALAAMSPTLSSPKSKLSVRVVVSIWGSSGMSSAAAAPNSGNLRAVTITRVSNDPAALL
jgi:hypothetical protein